MKIAIDAMGGDNAPFEIVKGVNIAAGKYSDVDMILIGDTDKINECFATLQSDIPKNISVIP